MYSTFLLAYPDIDPVLLSIGPIAIRWYSLAYIAGIIGGWWYLGKLETVRAFMSDTQRDDVILWAIVGIVLGGRFGYVFFYNTEYYLAHPGEILQVWQGGMSFHGGLLGVIAAFWGFSRYHKKPFLPLMDRIACVAPIGLFFGRLANFINGELYGRSTDAWVGMVFPTGGAEPRHPSQLYEAVLEGLLLVVLLWLLVKFSRALEKPGLCGGVFLTGYGAARFVVEYFREPDAHLGFVWLNFSMGQMLCIPMVALGALLITRACKRGTV